MTAAAVFVQPDQSAPESPGLDPQLGLSASRRTDSDFDDPEIFHNWRLWVITLDIYTAVLRRTGSQASAALYPRPRRGFTAWLINPESVKSQYLIDRRGKIGELMSHIDIEIPGHSIITQGH